MLRPLHRHFFRLGTAVLLVLLSGVLLGTAAAQQQAHGSSSSSSSSSSGSSGSLGRPNAASVCPGARNGVCQKECQLHLCEALAQFYKVANNLTDPWDEERGWEMTSRIPCQQLVASATGGRAVYCNWVGITCCTPGMLAAGNCTIVNAVAELNLPINNMNASVANPAFVQSVQELHGCGLTVLNIEANNLIDGLTEEYGTLVNLKVLSLGNCWLSGSIPDALRSLHNLTLINLSNNWLTGTLPNWLGELKQLQILNLGSLFGENEGTDGLMGLMGTIPSQLRSLQHLRELNLEANSLTGTLPQLCNGDDSSLLLLNLRSNRLSGHPESVASCGNLVVLDISDNQFTGTLPASVDWDELATYRANQNHFAGTIPVELFYYARILQHLELNDNQLTGDLANQIALLSYIKTLNVAGNNFSGTVSEDVFYLPSLMHLDMSRNSFVGTIPPAIGLAYGLHDADFSRNPDLTGVIPPESGLLSKLQIIRFANTSLSCSGLVKAYSVSTNNSCTDRKRCTTEQWFGNETEPHVCSDEELLPCFLHFSEYQVPRDDASNMRCRYILRKTQSQADADCQGSNPQSLADQAALLPEVVADDIPQSWVVDPSYYQYRECSCLVGYSEVWRNNGTKLVCVEQALTDRRLNAIIIGACVGAAGLFMLLGCLLLWRMYLRTQPRWLRERIMQGKRTKGPPRCTKPGEKITVSIVVTDVKDFSELTRLYPELMNKAMGGHNNILRKACNAHAGYVLDQEGDSWSVAFHDAEDACSFSLQVQQALAHKVWGMRLPNSDQTLDLLHNVSSLRHEGFSTKGNLGQGSVVSAGAGDSITSEAPQLDAAAAAACVRQQILQASEPSFRASRTGPSFTSSTGHHLDSASSASGLETQTSLQSGTAPSLAGSIGRLLGRHGSRSSKGSDVRSGSLPHAQLSFTDANGMRDVSAHGQRPPATEAGSSWASPAAGPPITSRSSFGSSMAPERAVGSFAKHSSAAGDGSASTRGWGAGNFMRKFSQMAGRSSAGNSSAQLPGDNQHFPLKVLRLAVRIGIATGPLPHGVDVNNCAVKDCAKEVVSDVANGGQVLMDEATFRLVKDSLSMLGTVTENGYDDDALQHLMHARVVGSLQHKMVCAGVCSRSLSHDMSFTGGLFDREPQDYDNDAIVVHMGCFDVPNAPMDDNGSPNVNSSGSDSDKEQLELVIPGSRRSRTQHKLVRTKLHLYSLASPGMRRRPENTQELTRLLGWAESVNAKPGWQQTQKGYFDAPCARLMDLTPEGSLFGHGQAPLPDVTIVFLSVAGASTFTSKRARSETHQVNKAIIKCLLLQMRALACGDGYLCRCQEADLKYMVAFEHPHNAVQWCLLVQEALMYVDWSDSVLTHPGFEEVLSPITGLPLFRGPRLRMGLAEGQPNSVLPDHEGRANYYGGSINRAARFMDATAHGGQVVTSLDLVRKLFMDWVSHDREQQQQPAAALTASSLASPTRAAGEAGAAAQQEPSPYPWHLQRQPSSPHAHEPRSLGVTTIAEGQLQTRWSRSRQRVAADQLASPMLQLAHRSRSETAARFDGHGSHAWSRHGLHLPLSRHTEEGHSSKARGSSSSLAASGLGLPPRSRSYTSSTRLSRAEAAEAAAAGAGPFSPFSLAVPGQHPRPQELPLAPVARTLDAVNALHLGTFAFKGSGEFEMVQILHAALEARVFPSEPPKGKGERVCMPSSGPVKDLPEVQLQVPTALVAARQAFSAFPAAGY